MSLQLPPTRDVPNPDAMFDRILSDADVGGDELQARRRPRAAWILGAAAALALVVLSSVLIRSFNSQRDPAEKSSSDPAVWVTTSVPSGFAPPKQAFVGDGRAVFSDLSVQLVVDSWAGANLILQVTVCAVGGRAVSVSSEQWTTLEYKDGPFSVDGDSNGPRTLSVPAGQCRGWNLVFVVISPPSTVIFTGANGEVAEWRLTG